MKEVYIILTQSGTYFSRLLKVFTGDEFNHASICLDKNFKEFYSFGRLKVNNPFIGGFVKENAFTHVFGKFERVPCMVIKKEISEHQYNKIRALINTFARRSYIYGYDYINLALAKTFFRVSHRKRFFCSEFVAHLFKKANVSIPKIPEKMKPYDFTEMDDVEVIYKGELKEWCTQFQKTVCE